MKITRMKKGYRINLSDTEYDLLKLINMEGIQAFYELSADDQTGLEQAEKRILTEIQTMKRDWMVITEDRRG